MFVHNVYFWLKNPENKEDGAKLAAGIKGMFGIDLIRTSYIGKCMPSQRDVVDSTYSYHLSLNFDNKEKHDAYQVHPTHMEFIENCAHLWKKVQVYDSESI